MNPGRGSFQNSQSLARFQVPDSKIVVGGGDDPVRAQNCHGLHFIGVTVKRGQMPACLGVPNPQCLIERGGDDASRVDGRDGEYMVGMAFEGTKTTS